MTKTEVPTLVAKQQGYYQQVLKTVSNFEKADASLHTVSYLETYIQTLEELWARFCDNHIAIHQLQDANAEDYIRGTIYEITEAKYIGAIAKIKELLKAIRLSESDSSSSSASFQSLSPPPSIQKPEIRLPRIALPTFDGSYKSWRSFRDLFSTLIHKDPRLSKVEKLHYLRTHVTGEAEQLLRQFDITNDNYIAAYELLEKRFDNKRILVNSQLKTLLNQPIIKSESAVPIKNTIYQTKEILHELKALGVETDSWGPILIHIIAQKLPNETLKLWEQAQGSETDIPKFQTLIDFLEGRFRTLEAVQENKSIQNSNYVQRNSVAFLNNKIQCPKCGKEHILFHCKQFINLPTNKKWALVKEKSLCRNCLSPHHQTVNCKSKRRCSKCNKQHNSLLHIANEKSEKRAPNSVQSTSLDTTPGSSETSTHSFLAANLTQALLATALVEVVGQNGDRQTLRALIDCGSQPNFITNRAATSLSLKTVATNVHVSGLESTPTARAQKKATFLIKSRNSNFSITVNALVIKTITDQLPSQPIKTGNLTHLNNLYLADPKFAEPGHIDLLLGAEVFCEIIGERIIRSSPKLPIAKESKLGWLIMGSVPANIENTYQAFPNFLEPTADTTGTILKRFWEVEEVNVKPHLTPDEKKCVEIFDKTVERLPSGAYRVALPFKDDNGPDLGESRHKAICQFLQLEKTFKNKPEFFELYKKGINEYLELQHMSPAKPITSRNDRTIKHFYLPHHAVMKESTTTKLRTVFNASAVSANGKSLNEQLLPGPTIQPTLWATLLRWRLYQYVYTADVEKMYRMVQIIPEHRDYQRIIWRNSPQEPIQEFTLNTVTFGMTPAAFLSIKSVQRLADDEAKSFPKASEIARKHAYVDDYLFGEHSVTEAIQLQKDLTELLKRGCFNLRKWTANHSDLLKHIPEDSREIKDTLKLKDGAVIKTLALQWHPSTDNTSKHFATFFNAME